MIEKTVNAMIAGITTGGWDYGRPTANPNQLLVRLKLPQGSCLGNSNHDGEMEDIFLVTPISEARDYSVGDTLRITIQKHVSR